MLLMQATTNLFRVADNEAELAGLRHAAPRPIPSIRGHRAGSPSRNAEDLSFLREAVRGWLAA